MPDAESPLLVHTRIEANRRKSRWLLALFGLLVVPFVLALVPVVLTVAGVLGAPLFTRVVQTPEQFLTAVVASLVLAGIAVLTLTALIAWAELTQGSRIVLRLAGAHPVTPEGEPALHRAVENLCIGAGLPMPRVHIAERAEPNAFAVGTEPSRASLVVTRGLLGLLRPRELQGVIAHELSHIANLDTRVGTTLAAVLATVRAPIALLHRLHPALAVIAAVLSGLMLVLSTLGMASWAAEVAYALWVLPEARQMLSALDVQDVLPMVLVFGYGLFFCSTPSYLLLGGHVLGRLIGGRVSRERELLADADAVMLTRDPEALALALVKIEAAQGASVSTSTTAAHLFIVAPAREKRPWWDAPIHSHPPIGERVELLGRMGPGISPELLRRAADEADAPPASMPPRATRSRPVAPPGPAAPLSDPPEMSASPPSGGPSPTFRLSPGSASFARALHTTSLLAGPDTDAGISGQIASGEIIALLGFEGPFLLVRTAAGHTGYISDTTKLSWELT